jgi:hypoxanthine phosphoribosyltransferase
MIQVTLKRELTWEWVEAQIEKVGMWLNCQEPIEFITGLPRGGLIPAVMISHKYGIKYIPIEQAKLLPQRSRHKTLVVDDIADTGITFAEIHDYDFLTLALAFRHNSKYVPDHYCELIEDARWQVFPWESKDSDSVQDYLK